jgi:hypothetical protein
MQAFGGGDLLGGFGDVEVVRHFGRGVRVRSMMRL